MEIKEPEYTLEQARRLLQLQSRRGFQHVTQCKKCDKGEFCEEDQEIQRACQKWDRIVRKLVV